MLFALSFLLFAVYILILIKDKDLRWVGWALGGVYFLIIVLFGDLLRSVFDMEQDSKTFFFALAFVYTVVPIVLAEITARFLPGYKTS